MSASPPSRCPFAAEVAGSSNEPDNSARHSAASLSNLRCPSVSLGCPFSSNSLNPDDMTTEQIVALSEKCPSCPDGRCPFSSASTIGTDGLGIVHPDTSSLLSDSTSKYPALEQNNSSSCILGSTPEPPHPQVNSLDSLSTRCPAFEFGCPFKPDSKQCIHPAIQFSDKFVKYLREVCPAFAGGRCPFAGIKALSNLNLKKCPAFTESCPFDRYSSQYRRLAELYPSDISKCKGFSQGCPFNPHKTNYNDSSSIDSLILPLKSSSDSFAPKGRSSFAGSSIHEHPGLKESSLPMKSPALVSEKRSLPESSGTHDPLACCLDPNE